MAQSNPKPHLLTYTIETETGRVDIGPLKYPSKGEAERAKRQFREANGENWVFATIEPVTTL